MSLLNNRLQKLEQAARPPSTPHYVVIEPDEAIESDFHFHSKEEAQAAYPGEELFFIIIKRDRIPFSEGNKTKC